MGPHPNASRDPEAKGIVVVGGGFAGFWAAVAARRVAGSSLRIRVVTREPLLQMRPRLYEADPGSLGVNLHPLLDPIGVEIVVGEVVGVDSAHHRITMTGGAPLSYECVVLAVGSAMLRPPIPGVEHAHSIDTQAEAIAFDDALHHTVARQPNATVVVIGAGFTGIELALELRERVAGHCGTAAAESMRVVLLDRAAVVGPELGPGPRPLIEAALAHDRIEMFLAASIAAVARIDHVGPTRTDAMPTYQIRMTDGTALNADLVVLTTGLTAAPLVDAVPGEHDEAGRIVVNPFLQAPAVGDVFVTGDAAAADTGGGHPSMLSCQHALQLGRYAGENAARHLLGLELVPYRQERYVTCLDLGRSGAVITTGWDRRVSLSGAEAKAVKQRINREVIYPPIGASADDLLLASALPES